MHPDRDLEQFYTHSHLPGVPRPFHQLPPEERIDWAKRMEKAQFEAWAKLHHYDLTRCSHEPYSAYRSDLTNAALAGWRGANRGVEQGPYPLAQAATPHTDDISVDMFALAMKDKMRQAREKGRGGWEMCSREELSRMLREHVAKGDPRDVANFCMMLWHLKAPIMAAAQTSESMVAVCCGRSECGGECGNEWRGMEPAQPDERSAFEEWAKDQGFPIGQSDVGDGLSYLDLRTQGAFDAWQASAAAPQSNHYQQLLGVAYVVLGCLVANGVDIPERFLDAFADPDSVDNPLELLPCDFSPAQAVRAAVEAEDAACVTKLRELLRTKRVADEEIDAWLNPEVDRRSVWFMYDCHQFARPDVSNPEAAFKSARELFDEDGCGSIFVKRWKDGPAIRELELGADYKRNGYKVLDEEIRAWVERYFAWKPDAAKGVSQ